MEKRSRRKIRLGRVISDKMDKTVVVVVERQFSHPIYGKIIKRRTKFKAHDEKNECHVGDTVKIAETRPMSREKRWRVESIVEKSR
ncbi:MAG: 30S ribosomal protein S17 [bacterium]